MIGRSDKGWGGCLMIGSCKGWTRCLMISRFISRVG